MGDRCFSTAVELSLPALWLHEPHLAAAHSRKRTLSKRNAFDLIVTVALGSTLATAIMSKNVALTEGIATMALLIICQFLVTWLSVRSGIVRRVVRREPTMLVQHGEYLRDAAAVGKRPK